MSADEKFPDWVVNPGTPSVARIYDYVLGGKDNFAVDREAAEAALSAVPDAREHARQNRRFLIAAVTELVRLGVRQFIDIGSGLPTQENVHQVAQREAPESTVVYVDSDPVVLAHARALLADNANTTVIQGDLRNPSKILDHPEVVSRIDFTRPVAVLALAILHFIPDEDDPAARIETYKARLAPGSALVLSHGHQGAATAESVSQVRSAYKNTQAGGVVPRDGDAIRSFFTGTDLLGPGLVPVKDWTADAAPVELDPATMDVVGAVGRIR